MNEGFTTINFDIMPACDGQAGGQNCYVNINSLMNADAK